MAERTITFTDAADRKSQLSTLHAQGFRPLHTNYVAGWKHGDAEAGEVVLTDEVDQTVPNLAVISERKAARESGLVKLAALGLTDAELAGLFGS